MILLVEFAQEEVLAWLDSSQKSVNQVLQFAVNV